MISYFVTSAHRYTMDSYLQTWGMSLRSIIQVRHYGELATIEWLPGGTYIFSDLERLTPAQRAITAEIWAQLEAATPNVRLLNHPRRVLLRADLLQCLQAAGRNEFRIHRVDEERTPVRFPVFIRCANDHEGSRTGLLNTQDEVDAHIRAALCYGHRPEELLVVEYCGTADAGGIHHKYSAFAVGGQILPRHLIFSRQWMLKYPDLLDDGKIAREHDYLQTNPHASALREAFQLAHIDYGRCDYALVNGRIQVWEINTNPVVMLSPEQYQRPHLPAQEYFAHRIRAAFESLNLEVDPQLRIPIGFDRPLMDRVIGAARG